MRVANPRDKWWTLRKGSRNLESDIAARILAQALKEDRLVGLIGSGASASARDHAREYRGLPTPTEFVESISQRYSYIEPTMSFSTACDAIFAREHRAGLEEALLRYFRVPGTFDIPPAHQILSWLPFSLYITSNYDQFVERSLEREHKYHYVIIENQDVVGLRRGYTPVIKYHGCVSRPRTMLATTSDFSRADRVQTLVQELISVSLASRTLLVIGHGLNDTDLSTTLNRLLEQLHDYAPSIFVIREPGHSDRIPHLTFAHEVVAEDLTQFLNRILHEYRQEGLEHPAPFREEVWLRSAFFAALKQAVVLPSETQVIDAFLNHLAEELGARSTEVESVVSDANIAIEGALRERPNYTALQRTWAMVTDELKSAGNDLGKAEAVVRAILAERESKKAVFYAVGREMVEANDRLFLFSQSQRVLQALVGVPQAIQRTCEIFVAECRPKSPNAYQDAIAICRSLSDTYYAITICPDVVALNLIATGQISKAIVGTHAIYVNENNQPYAFVNTCGSQAISLACDHYRVPLFVIGESLKVESVSQKDAEDHMYSHQENDLLEGQLGVTELATKRSAVSHTNIGYDLVQVNPMIRIMVPDVVAS